MTLLPTPDTLLPKTDLLNIVDLPNAESSSSRSGPGGAGSRLSPDVVLILVGGDEGIGIPESEGRRRVDADNPIPVLDLLLVEALPSNIGVGPPEEIAGADMTGAADPQGRRFVLCDNGLRFVGVWDRDGW